MNISKHDEFNNLKTWKTFKSPYYRSQFFFVRLTKEMNPNILNIWYLWTIVLMTIISSYLCCFMTNKLPILHFLTVFNFGTTLQGNLCSWMNNLCACVKWKWTITLGKFNQWHNKKVGSHNTNKKAWFSDAENWQWHIYIAYIWIVLMQWNKRKIK
jgi:hypothetical protein